MCLNTGHEPGSYNGQKKNCYSFLITLYKNLTKITENLVYFCRRFRCSF